TQPGTPLRLGGVATGGDARDVAVKDGFAFVADAVSSFTVVDVRDPNNPRFLASTPPDTGGLLMDVALARDLAFGADFFFVNGLPIIGLTPPERPTPRAILDFSAIETNSGKGIAADETHVYMAASEGGEETGVAAKSRLYIGQYLQVEDTAGQAPQVRVTAPAAGAELTAGSVVEFAVDAVDDVAVSAVEFLAGGVLLFTDSTAPFSMVLQVPLELGQLVLGARAVDFGGNEATADPVTVEIVGDDQPPEIVRVEPGAGASFTSGQPIPALAEVEDNQALAEVVFRLGEQSFTDRFAPFAVSLTAPPVAQATDAVLEIEAIDASDNRAAVQVPLRIEPSPDGVPPVVRLLAPGDGDGLLAGRSVPIAFSLEDDSLLHSYTLRVNGQPIAGETYLNQALVERALAWSPPPGTQPGDMFVLRLEASDYGLNAAAREVRLVVPAGTFLDGDQVLDASLTGQALVLGAGSFTAAEPLHLASLVLLDGARVRGSSAGLLSIEVDGALHVGAGASLDTSAQGYAGGRAGHLAGFAPDFISASQPDAGGSHGGFGIVGRNAGPAGAVFD
ncbi:MAG: Ig-like domain-containing protein, partial [Candidatus Rokuibacteriota bacterium]